MNPAASATRASATAADASTIGSRPIELVQQRPGEPAEPDRRGEADRAPDRGHQPTCRSTMPRTRAGVGAERHAQPDLPRALGDRVGQHAVESDRRQQRRERRERARTACVIKRSRNTFSRTCSGMRPSPRRAGSGPACATTFGIAAGASSGSRPTSARRTRSARRARPGAHGRKNSGGTSSLTSLYFASCTSPTISMSSCLPVAVAHELADGVVARD